MAALSPDDGVELEPEPEVDAIHDGILDGTLDANGLLPEPEEAQLQSPRDLSRPLVQRRPNFGGGIPLPPSQRMGQSIRMRLLPADEDRVRARAKAEGRPMAEMLRDAVLAYLDTSAKASDA